MTDELVFYTNPMSRGRIVRWMLEEIGPPYRTEILDYGTTMKAPAYLAINPMGKVPAIAMATRRHRGRRDLRLSRRCVSRRPVWRRRRRPAARDVLSLAVLRRRAAGSRGQQQGAGLRRAAGARAHDRLWHLRGRHGRAGRRSRGPRYLAGDRFTAADVYVGSHLGFGMQFGTIEKRPAFESYWRRLASRPAALRARQIDDALMAQHPIPGTPAG